MTFYILLFIYRIDNSYNVSETKNKEKAQLVDHLMKDSTYNRLVSLQKACRSFVINLMAFCRDNQKIYSDIFFFINPIVSITSPDINLMSNLMRVTIGEMMMGGLKLQLSSSKMSIVTIQDLDFEDENQYIPGKRKKDEMISLVRYTVIDFLFCPFVIKV